MSLNSLVSQLKSNIESFSPQSETSEIGVVVSVADGIAKVSGLSGCQVSELVHFESGVRGLALNLEQDFVGVVILGDYRKVHEGEIVKLSGSVLSIPVGDSVLGRVVDPFVQAIDGGAELVLSETMPIERIAPGVMSREPVSVPLQTGIKAIDTLVPIGRGQRELIIGDRQTGKTAVAIDAILNQKGTGVICIYVAIGQKKSKVTRIVSELRDRGALEYTTVVLAGASDNPALLYLAPYAGVTLAEYFMDQGKDVLVVYDDLSKHAVAYREMSLLLRRAPGREAYPGDVFYLHSRLLERACRRNEASGGGSITALPIIETQGGDVSAYIPTNVISITDGQIFLESSLFFRGVRPAINVGISVSRVGGSAQTKAMKKNAGPMKLALAQYRELESFSQFDSDLDAQTKSMLDRGARTVELLKQKQYAPVSTALQVVTIFAVNNGLVDDIAVADLGAFEEKLHTFVTAQYPEFLEKISKTWDDSCAQELTDIILEYKRT